MDTDVNESFAPGIARQLNYTRTFVGLDKVIVHIPGGFHLESFDQKEKRIGLKSLFLLVDSALTYAHWPGKDDKSFLDIHKIRGNILYFTSYSRCEIDQSFYKISSPKWPLDVTLALTHIGTTSYTVSFSLRSPGQMNPYATIWFVTVFVDLETRRSCPLPVWWRNTFSNLAYSNIPLRMETLFRPTTCSCLPVSIYYSDTDSNQHTNWATYIRACYDAFMDGAMRRAYSVIAEEEASKGVNTFEIRFLKESLMGDILDVYSWEITRSSNKELCFEIKKGSDVCCQAVMTFHTNMAEDEIRDSKL